MATQTDKVLEKAINTGSAQPAYLLLGSSTLNLNTTIDQPVSLRGGTIFSLVDILITNVSKTPVNAYQGEWWTGPNRTGNQIAYVQEYNVPSPAFQYFTSSNLIGNSLSNQNSMTFIVLNQNINNQIFYSATSPLYFSLGTAEGAPLTCDMYIYGTILQ